MSADNGTRFAGGVNASKTGYTPGPWIWGEKYCGLYGTGQNNAVLDFAAYEGMWLNHYNMNMEANARLIAAAPALVEALKDAIAFGLADEDGAGAVEDQMRAALKGAGVEL